jgi:hypothetical protein
VGSAAARKEARVERAERVKRNESFFREVNAQIEQLSSHATALSLQIVCECAKVDCMRILEVPEPDYQAVRRHENRFIVAKGHEMPEYEKVVGDANGYFVVQKTRGKETDPRARDDG